VEPDWIAEVLLRESFHTAVPLRCTVDSKSGTATVDELIGVWQRVLQRSPINPDENFSDLTTDDSLADCVFAEIARQLGRELPSATICYAQTISALAAVVEHSELPRFPPLVLLKSGNDQQPIFIAPGIGGRASFSSLAKHMKTERSIYGIQARGVEGLEEPFERIEDMAEFYLKAITQLQSQGPYFLIGYSFGGLLAVEMARRITAGGQQVAMLTMIDTYPHPRYLPFGERLRFNTNRVKAAFWKRVRREDRSMVLPQTSPGSFAHNMQRVKQSDFVALARYRPSFYSGPVKFVRPEAAPYLASNPFNVWKKLVGELQIETVPGDHLGVVAAHPERLAAVLTRYVGEASAEAKA
jgi:acetoacetyl-CoA synthetase